MDFSLLSVTSFKSVFKGNYSVKGITKTKSKSKDGKLEADCYLDKTSLSNEDIIKHLKGEKGIGMAPITEEGLVYFAVIDIDIYSLSVESYISTIYAYDIPIMPFYSKSKGVHGYVFFSEGVQPTQAIDLLIRLRMLLGLPKDTEIFPKQRTVDKGSYASWINLPYFDSNNPDNPRKLVRADNTLAPLEEALAISTRNKKTIKQFNDILDALPLADAPPCLQTIYMLRQTDFRNEYLFSLGVYCKSKYEDNFDEELVNANHKLLLPIEDNELNSTVLKALTKKDYSYKCATPPLNLLCNKAECRNRKFGIGGSSTISTLSFEDLIQYDSDPPYYEWVINGIALKFFKESDIIMQQNFREMCFRKLHILPPRLPDAKWTRIVNNALENITVKIVDKDSDLSVGGVWLGLVTDFFLNRTLAINKRQLKTDRVFRDNEMNAYLFKASAILEYLRKVKNFRAYSDTEIQSKLKDLGAQQVVYAIDETLNMKLWSMPVSSIRGDRERNLDDIEMSFFDEERPGDKY